MIVYYLDDSAVSKRFAPWCRNRSGRGRSIDLLPLTIDPLQGRSYGASRSSHLPAWSHSQRW